MLRPHLCFRPGQALFKARFSYLFMKDEKLSKEGQDSIFGVALHVAALGSTTMRAVVRRNACAYVVSAS